MAQYYCNLCSTHFESDDIPHSEFQQCSNCSSIARERVTYWAILQHLNETGRTNEICLGTHEHAKHKSLLECSPRKSETKKEILSKTFSNYITSDFDMSAHSTDIYIDLTQKDSLHDYIGKFDYIICAHVLEHIPDYQRAIQNLNFLLKEGGVLILQVPLLEKSYVKVTWDEYHGDKTKVYHRFSFDLIKDIKRSFHKSNIIIGKREYNITSPEIDIHKYSVLLNEKTYSEIGQSSVTLFGLGNLELCDAFVCYK